MTKMIPMGIADKGAAWEFVYQPRIGKLVNGSPIHAIAMSNSTAEVYKRISLRFIL